MKKYRCKIEMSPDELFGAKFRLEGPECRKLIDDIHKFQGPYSKRYFDMRIELVEDSK